MNGAWVARWLAEMEEGGPPWIVNKGTEVIDERVERSFFSSLLFFSLSSPLSLNRDLVSSCFVRNFQSSLDFSGIWRLWH